MPSSTSTTKANPWRERLRTAPPAPAPASEIEKVEGAPVAAAPRPTLRRPRVRKASEDEQRLLASARGERPKAPPVAPEPAPASASAPESAQQDPVERVLRNKSKIIEEIENSDLGADVKSVMSQLLQVGLSKGFGSSRSAVGGQ